ncbi:F-box/WD repeat-containing protein pof1 [Taphrina deformans PYCC 5710]|uniref:F-box/WD repeat-containing protein pof1 n=1 Tax=Taphrina deformans (strain PYCC 5710 / ATCC 11124 / CBS 356.35 / IMI 108563 / JCM 9778 / NBRC 8474) TaxID=1097556 RepID=R4XD31_TAPDE|nr:F-box/WD repeat-containing protein pof1 [Taphrina deformans PYCC 5710]|eukprot:CCG81230.1 F-box/WD repeat-containing protein pof1 [Taphrina deformans PYCC 5710]
MPNLSITSTLKGSSKPIVAISRFRQLLATSSEDGSLKIWNLDTFKVLHGFLPSCFEGAAVTSILWRNDRTLLVSADTSLYTITIPSTGGPLLSKTASSCSRIATDEINAMTQLDKNRVAVADDSGAVIIYNLTKSCTTATFRHGNMVTSLARSGDTLVSGSLDCRVLFWDLKSGRTVHELDVAGHRRAAGSGMGEGVNPPYVHALAGHRGTVVAGLGDGGVLVTREVGVGRNRTREVASVTAHGVAVNALLVLVLGPATGPGPEYLLTASNDRTCKLWRLDALFRADVEPVSVVQVPGKVNAMAVLSDTKAILGDVCGNLTVLSLTPL